MTFLVLNVGFCVLALSVRDREEAAGEGGGMVEEAEGESEEELRTDNFEGDDRREISRTRTKENSER